MISLKDGVAVADVVEVEVEGVVSSGRPLVESGIGRNDGGRGNFCYCFMSLLTP